MKNKFLRRVRSIFLAALFVLTLIVPSSVDRAEAQFSRGHEVDYYANPNFTDLVGFVIFCTNGQVIRSGQTSSYYQITPAGC